MNPTTVTFTANPSIDKTISLHAQLGRGDVQRASSATEQAAGKGVNVALVTAAAGVRTSAVLPFTDEAYLRMLAPRIRTSLAVEAAPSVARSRTNTALTEPDGTTTKVNEPGPTLSSSDLDIARATLVDASAGASWVVLSGSLPPGAPDDWYVTLTASVKKLGCKVAIDTSDAALDAVLAALPGTPFDLIKPNSDELAQLTGGDAAAFEEAAQHGELGDIVIAARRLQERGISNVMVTLGGAGAVLVTSEGAWYATAPAIKVKSTVGAGDSSVAGFIIADVAGKSAPECLASAVAYGSAAAGLPGSTLPTPTDVHPGESRVSKLA